MPIHCFLDPGFRRGDEQLAGRRSRRRTGASMHRAATRGRYPVRNVSFDWTPAFAGVTKTDRGDENGLG